MNSRVEPAPDATPPVQSGSQVPGLEMLSQSAHSGNPFDLHGRIALVTGSSSGLGLEMARALASAGAVVVLNGRDDERLQRAERTLASRGLNVHTSRFDVTREDEILAAVAAIERDIGPIRILINNAGIQRRGLIAELSRATWDDVIARNLTSVFSVGRTVAANMKTRRQGKIINICSLMSEVARPSIAPYAAAKGGVKMLTRAMSVEWAESNIQVNGIGPGYFLSEMSRSLAENPEFDNWVRQRTPARRWGKPEDLSATAIYLASDASDFVNGQIIYVDGGILASL